MTDYDPTRRPRKYFEEPETKAELKKRRGIGTLAVIAGAMIVVVVGIIICVVLFCIDHKHWFGF